MSRMPPRPVPPPPYLSDSCEPSRIRLGNGRDYGEVITLGIVRSAQKLSRADQNVAEGGSGEGAVNMYDAAEIFNELAPLLRVRPQLQQICRFGAQWSSQHEPEP